MRLPKFFTAVMILTASLFFAQENDRSQAETLSAGSIIDLVTSPAGAKKISVLLDESFENSVPPSGWIKIANGNSDKGWSQMQSKKHRGSSSAGVSYDANFFQEEWLISPAIDLSTASHGVNLQFWEEEAYWADYGDHHYVKISTAKQDSIESFVTIKEMTPLNHVINGFGGEPTTLDLSSYQGQTIYIALVYTGQDADNWYVDDFQITAPEEKDLAVNSFKMNASYAGGTSVTPKVTVSNVGYGACDAFSVVFGYLNWDGSENILDTQAGSALNAGNQIEISFASFSMPENIEYSYFAKVLWAQDTDTSNNIIKKGVYSFTHTRGMVLQEKATGTWCQYCPASAVAADSINSQQYSDIATLEYHGGDALQNDTYERLVMYGISGYPTAIFDGTDWQVGGGSASEWAGLLSTFKTKVASAQQKKTGLSVQLEILEQQTDQITAVATISYLATSYAHSYRLYYGLNESDITWRWGGLTELNYVARALYPDVNGKILYDGSNVPFEGFSFGDTLRFDFPSGVNKGNAQLIVFIQNMESLEVMAVDKKDFDKTTAIGDENDNRLLPESFSLQQNFPNPFNPDTKIRFNLPQNGFITLTIYNSVGQKIRTLENGILNGGGHAVLWDGKDDNHKDVSSGVYYSVVNFGKKSKAIKMIKLK